MDSTVANWLHTTAFHLMWKNIQFVKRFLLTCDAKEMIVITVTFQNLNALNNIKYKHLN
jgi:hypothetical protein